MATIDSVVLRFSADLGDLNAKLASVDASVKGFSDKVDASSSRLKNFASTAAGFATAQIGMKVIGGVFEDAYNYTIGFNAQLQQSNLLFTQVFGSSSAAKSFLTNLQAFSAKTPFQFQDLVGGAQQLAISGVQAKALIPVISAIGDAVSGLPNPSAHMSRVIYAMSEMQRMGVVQQRQMRMMEMDGVNAGKYMAAGLGIPQTQLTEMIKKGQLSGTAGMNALIKGIESSNLGGHMAAQAETFNGALTTIHDSLQISIARAFRPFFQEVSEGTVGLSRFLLNVDFTGFITKFGNSFASGSEKVIAALKAIVPVLLAVWNALVAGIRFVAELVAMVAPLVELFVKLATSTVGVTIWAIAEAFSHLLDWITKIHPLMIVLSLVVGTVLVAAFILLTINMARWMAMQAAQFVAKLAKEFSALNDGTLLTGERLNKVELAQRRATEATEANTKAMLAQTEQMTPLGTELKAHSSYLTEAAVRQRAFADATALANKELDQAAAILPEVDRELAVMAGIVDDCAVSMAALDEAFVAYDTELAAADAATGVFAAVSGVLTAALSRLRLALLADVTAMGALTVVGLGVIGFYELFKASANSAADAANKWATAQHIANGVAAGGGGGNNIQNIIKQNDQNLTALDNLKKPSGNKAQEFGSSFINNLTGGKVGSNVWKEYDDKVKILNDDVAKTNTEMKAYTDTLAKVDVAHKMTALQVQGLANEMGVNMQTATQTDIDSMKATWVEVEKLAAAKGIDLKNASAAVTDQLDKEAIAEIAAAAATTNGTDATTKAATAANALTAALAQVDNEYDKLYGNHFAVIDAQQALNETLDGYHTANLAIIADHQTIIQQQQQMAMNTEDYNLKMTGLVWTLAQYEKAGNTQGARATQVAIDDAKFSYKNSQQSAQSSISGAHTDITAQYKAMAAIPEAVIKNLHDLMDAEVKAGMSPTKAWTLMSQALEGIAAKYPELKGIFDAYIAASKASPLDIRYNGVPGTAAAKGSQVNEGGGMGSAPTAADYAKYKSDTGTGGALSNTENRITLTPAQIADFTTGFSIANLNVYASDPQTLMAELQALSRQHALGS
jgi:tape measure domain-containing protein